MKRFMVTLLVSLCPHLHRAAPARSGAFTADSLVSWIPMILKTDRGDAGRRIDLVLRRHLAGVGVATRTRIQDWIEAGHVSVNGAAVRRVSTRTAAGDVIAVALPAEAARRPMEVEQVPLHILHEDDHLLAVNKPSGIVSHPTHAHKSGTLMNALLWHARRWPAGQRPSLVGRLDKLTSGIVLVAKTPEIHAALQRGKLEKDYLALVYGRSIPARGAIDLRLARDGSDRRRVAASESVGAPSVTHFERLARVPAPHVGLGLLRCRLRDGADSPNPCPSRCPRLADRGRSGLRGAAVGTSRGSTAARGTGVLSATSVARLATWDAASDDRHPLGNGGADSG